VALIVLPWLPICGPSRDATPARRIRGIGEAPIGTFAFGPAGATIAAIQTDRHVSLWDSTGGAVAPSVLDGRGPARHLAFASDGRSLAVGGTGADLILYAVRAGGKGRPLGMPIREVKGLAFSPGGRTLAASSYLDPEILLWDLSGGRERARLRGHESPVLCLAFAPDGRSLASGSRGDKAILVWDLATGRPRRRLVVPPGPVLCLAYSPDGRWLASMGTIERSVRLWDLEGRGGDRPIGRHSNTSAALAFSPDGRMLATADDGVVRLWDLETGAELRQVGEPGDRLAGVAFAPDGRTLAATGDDPDIRLWRLADLLGTQPDRDR
jgi:WD40 repeat protein